MTLQLTWKAEDVIRAVNGHYLHEQTWTAHGVSIDNRKVKPGDLFIALDDKGHEQVAAAFAAGAAAAIVSHQPQAPSQAPLITVADTVQALEDLGRAGRQRSQARIVAISGSGHTGSKDMLRLMLNEVGDTSCDGDGDGNHLSLSLARLPEAAFYGIVDTPLSQQIQPDVAFVPAAEASHLEFLISSAAADASPAIFTGMKSSGVAVLNRDNPQLSRLSAAAKAQGVKKILGFGRSPKADARLIDCQETPEGSWVKADILGRLTNYSLHAPGMQVALHSLGALCAATALGADRDACAAALAHYRKPKEQGVIQTVMLPEGELTLIDESHDARHATMRFAIRVLGQMTPETGGQRILVLGDNAQPYPDLARDIVEAKIASVFTCGTMMEPVYESLPPSMRGFHAGDSIELARRVTKAVYPGDVVTVKGSPDAGMEIIVDALKALGDDVWKAHQLAS